MKHLDQPYHNDTTTSGTAPVACTFQRIHADQRHPSCWLMTLSVGVEHGWGGGGEQRAVYPQAYAVMDNFGNRVAVEQWA